jgi:hypothetical protein
MLLRFVIASLLCFLGATNGFEVLASVSLTEAPVFSALRESIHTSLSQPIGSLLLAAPFLCVGIVATKLAKHVGLFQAKIFFVFSVVALGALYLSGYWAAQQALLAQKWTAAALSVGLLPFQSILILVLAAFPAGFMFWRAERAKT